MSGIYHSWNGTVLTVTSDSGTSSADLKGDMGIRGPQGVAGIMPIDVSNTPIEVSYSKNYMDIPFPVKWTRYLDGRAECIINYNYTSYQLGDSFEIELPFVMYNPQKTIEVDTEKTTPGATITCDFISEQREQRYLIHIDFIHEDMSSVEDDTLVEWVGAVKFTGYWKRDV